MLKLMMQKNKNKYFYQSFLKHDFCHYFLIEFYERKGKIKSMNDLIKEFEDVVANEYTYFSDHDIQNIITHVITQMIM